MLLTPDRAAPMISVLIGVANGVVIAGIEIFVLREGSSMSRLTRLPFIVVVILKTVAYGAVVTATVEGAPLVAAFIPLRSRPAPLDPHAALTTIGFSLATTAIFVIVLQASALLGRRTFRNLVLGRYRRPRAGPRWSQASRS